MTPLATPECPQKFSPIGPAVQPATGNIIYKYLVLFKDGFSTVGFNKKRFSKKGFSKEGFSKKGFSMKRFSKNGFSKKDLVRNELVIMDLKRKDLVRRELVRIGSIEGIQQERISQKGGKC